MNFDLSRRRSLLTAAAATAALTACASTSPSAAQPRKNFVLVHGAWHGGWCWIRVRDALEAQGHRVYTPTLAGLADKRHLLNPNIDLQTHVADVVNLIRFESLDSIVLVGHSYAGVVVAHVVEQVPEVVRSIVFVDAYMPEDGRSLFDDAPAAVKASWAQAAANSAGMNTVPPIPAAFFRVNASDAAMVDAKCTPHPYKTLLDKARLTGARDRVPKKAYLRASRFPNPAFDAFYERRAADPTWKTARVDSGHDMMLDAPEELTRMLLGFS